MMYTLCKYADETELVASDIIEQQKGEMLKKTDIGKY